MDLSRSGGIAKKKWGEPQPAPLLMRQGSVYALLVALRGVSVARPEALLERTKKIAP
jgi:hypothetical protein